MEAVVVIPAAELNLQTLVTADVRCEPRERLLPGASDADQQRVAPLLADHPCDSAEAKRRKAEFQAGHAGRATVVVVGAVAPEQGTAGMSPLGHITPLLHDGLVVCLRFANLK